MKNYDEFKKQIEACTTPNQVAKVLKKHNVNVVKDNSKEVGCFSIWLDAETRIYKPSTPHSKMVLQRFKPVTMKYSGIPTFFSTGL